MDNNLNILLASSFTKPQVIKRLSLLHDFLNYWLFASNLPLEKALAEFSKKDLESKLIGSFSINFFKQFNSQNVTQLLKDLNDQVNKFQLLTITIPVFLPEHEVIRIGHYLRTNFNSKFLIELKVDPSLIAGAALTYGGNYRDYSLKAKIAENRNVIIEDVKKGLS